MEKFFVIYQTYDGNQLDTHIYGVVGEGKTEISLELLSAVEKSRTDLERVRELYHKWKSAPSSSGARKAQKAYFELHDKTPSWGFKFRNTIMEYPDEDFKISDILTMDEFFDRYNVDGK